MIYTMGGGGGVGGAEDFLRGLKIFGRRKGGMVIIAEGRKEDANFFRCH